MKKICINGHKFYKSSDCPVCPICERKRKPTDGFLSLIAAPARRALENNGNTSLKKLSRYTEQEIQGLHGMGSSTIFMLRKVLKENGLSFRQVSP